MQDFLDSKTFEEMAKEYNKKYCSNVFALDSTKILDFEMTKTLFDNIYVLIYLYEKVFKRNSKFFDVTNKVKKLKADLQSFFSANFSKNYEENFDKPKNLFINQKIFIKTFVDALLLFEDLISTEENQNVLLQLKALKLDYIKLIKDFVYLI